MSGRLIRMHVDAAKEDLRNRTLAPIGYDFGRLLYLASMRDCSSGEYNHQGLARCFSEFAAREALATCHKEIFYTVATCPLELFVPQVERFMRSANPDLRRTLDSWFTLEGYRMAIPQDSDRLTVGLFLSNVRIAMVLLKSRLQAHPMRAQSAWPHLSPGR
jgi:hypothetical protein